MSSIGNKLSPAFLLSLGAFLILVLTFSATQAFAHVRWFVDTNVTIENFVAYRITDPEVLIWIAMSIMIVLASFVLDTKLPEVRVVGSETRHDFIEILRIFTGMSLLLTAYEGALLAPHLVAYGAFGTKLIFLQAIIGILLIANRFVRHAAILLIILHLGLTIQFGVLAALEYLSMVGIAIFLLINNLPTPELRAQYKPFSVAIMRILVGISLITLGLAEKLFGAILAESFLAANPWNFLPALGFEFVTDRLFALSAGFVEVIFGIIPGAWNDHPSDSSCPVYGAFDVERLVSDRRQQRSCAGRICRSHAHHWRRACPVAFGRRPAVETQKASAGLAQKIQT
ncbi:hypothetical protein K3729_17810 (plasmid) [Rhodobacteraceae bacterium S2214]|nr:hypothetical protein K3729_17810 [Rhodobacteraceae bacterium S2214]